MCVVRTLEIREKSFEMLSGAVFLFTSYIQLYDALFRQSLR